MTTPDQIKSVLNRIDRETSVAIKARRIAVSMTQVAMAKDCGLLLQQIHIYESGVNRVAVSRLIQIALVLGTLPGTLLETATSAACSENLRDTLGTPIEGSSP